MMRTGRTKAARKLNMDQAEDNPVALKRAKTESHLDDLKAIGFVRDINALPMSLYHPDSQPASADTQEETKTPLRRSMTIPLASLTTPAPSQPPSSPPGAPRRGNREIAPEPEEEEDDFVPATPPMQTHQEDEDESADYERRLRCIEFYCGRCKHFSYELFMHRDPSRFTSIAEQADFYLCKPKHCSPLCVGWCNTCSHYTPKGESLAKWSSDCHHEDFKAERATPGCEGCIAISKRYKESLSFFFGKYWCDCINDFSYTRFLDANNGLGVPPFFFKSCNSGCPSKYWCYTCGHYSLDRFLDQHDSIPACFPVTLTACKCKSK